MTNPNTKYKTWINENKKTVKEYIEQHDVVLTSIRLSSRAINVMYLNGYSFISQIFGLSYDELIQLEAMDAPTAKEIYYECRHYLLEHKNAIIAFSENSKPKDDVSELQSLLNSVEVGDVNNDDTITKGSQDTESSEKNENEIVVDYPIEVLNLSTRAFNSLKLARINTITELIKRFPKYNTKPESLCDIRNMGVNSAYEVSKKLAEYLANNSVTGISNVNKTEESSTVDLSNLSGVQIINNSNYREKALEYIEQSDFDLIQWQLSNRSTNALNRHSIHTFYELINIFPEGISSIRNLGQGSIREISEKVYQQLDKIQPQLVAYCNGDEFCIYTNEYIKEQILSQFNCNGFVGLSYKEIRALFPEGLKDEIIKKSVGELIAERELEYVDFRCYRIYPSFFEFLNSENTDLDEKTLSLFRKRYAGETLEEIAKEFDLTRERVRQIIAGKFKLLRKTYTTLTGNKFFDEDYYEYLFTNYEVFKDTWINYLNVPENVFNYLKISYKKGNKALVEALSDSKVDYSIKLRIRDYENRNKLLLDGTLVDNTHTAVEEFVLSRYANDEMKYDTFMELCNTVLKDNHIPYSEKYYYSPKISRTRGNHLAGSMMCLWKHGERIRYYDIENTDLTELMEVLNLNGYKNTEVSTLKFIEDYPELMEKYDIRDQYELHNLLKKTIPNGSFNDISFGRQPIITFGEFDRTAALFEILKAVAPVTIEDFTEYIHMEYGYEKSTTTSIYIQPLMKYYHNGVFSIDFKKVPEERTEEFKAALSEDFYLIEDIEKLYSSMYPNADLEEINPYSLKEIGFIVYSKHVVRNTYRNSEEYFVKILTENDVFSIKPFSERFATISQYHAVYMELRKNYDIMLFENDQLINIRRLEKLNISKDDIIEYCKSVIDYVDESEFFTIYSLHESGFNSKLDELGFDDSFYAGILSMYPAFSYQRIFGTVVLKVDSNNELFSKKTFILSQLSKYDSVDTYEFIDDCDNEFGIRIPERNAVITAISGTDFYYDSIMDKFYRNKNYYYDDLDD